MDILYNEYMKTLTYQLERKELDYDRVEYIIKKAFPDLANNIILISGGCGYTALDFSNYLSPGVDEWAEIVADVLGIPKDIHYAPAGQWNDKLDIIYETPRGNLEQVLKGYQTRNIEIAKTCGVLYCFDPKWRGSKTGGQWTMRYAQKLGKETHLVQIE